MQIHSVDDRILIDCTIAEYGGLIAVARELDSDGQVPHIARPIGDLLAANADWELPMGAGDRGPGTGDRERSGERPHRVPPARCRTNAEEVRMINAELASIQAELVGRSHTARIASELVGSRPADCSGRSPAAVPTA